MTNYRSSIELVCWTRFRNDISQKNILYQGIFSIRRTLKTLKIGSNNLMAGGGDSAYERGESKIYNSLIFLQCDPKRDLYG